jgi:type II secretory pathway component GspD/PulD (secretin)
VTYRASTRKSQDAVLEAEERAIRPPVRIPETRPAWPRRSDDPTIPKREKMAKTLEESVTVDFVNADLEWVLNTLFVITGVNIIADPAALQGKSLTLHVEKIPLREVLNFIIRNNDGVQMSVTEDAVWITATSASDLKKLMIPRVYPIHHGLVTSKGAQGMSAGQRSGQNGRAGGGNAGGGARGGGAAAGGQGGQGGQGQQGNEESYLELVLDWLQTQADPQSFPDGSQWFIDKPSNQLVVFTTPAGHDKIREFLDTFDQPPIQVLIKARFLRTNDNDEKALGANLDFMSGELRFGQPHNVLPWSFTNNAAPVNLPGTLISNSNIFQVIGSRVDPKFQLTIRALLANSNTRVLAEPQILAINNKEAFIDITTNFSYITDLREVTGTQFGGNGTAATNVVAYVPEFDTENIGFTLFVTPSVGRDLKTINLHIRPIIDDLAEGQKVQDFQNFQVINAQASVLGNSTPPVIQRPTIDQTSLETDAVLEDNGYVIIGGLVRNRLETVEKKVPGLHRIPGLGYLFKNKSELRQRYNLTIVLEAQIITPRGRTYRTSPNPDDGDIREGGTNRAPGQVSEMKVHGLPQSELKQIVAPPPLVPTQGAWRAGEEEKGQ